MAPFSLTLKHAGKAYPLPDFDPSNSALAFKDQIYHLTGVPADKVKVPVKGGMLKVRCTHSRLLPALAPTADPLPPAAAQDDADLSKLAFKPVRPFSRTLLLYTR